MIAAAGTVIWLARHKERQYAMAVAVLAGTFGVVYLKWVMFPDMNRVASARPLWFQIRNNPDRYCVGDLHRNLLYGLNYYTHKPLPRCEDAAGRERLDR
jgi:hypothetical protein